MPIYSHSRRATELAEGIVKGRTDRRVGSKTLVTHTDGVHGVAVAGYHDGVDFGAALGLGWREVLGEVLRLHDLG